MSAFVHLDTVLRSLETDPSTARQPIKPMFLFDGDFLTANVAVIDEAGDTLHTQPKHDEIVLVLEGAADFRVGYETRRVTPGDLIFIPPMTVHGPNVAAGKRFAAVSIFASYFDRTEENIQWERDRT